MTNLQERLSHGFEATRNRIDRAEDLGAAALRKIGVSRENSERFVDFATRGIGALAVVALGVGAAETVSYGVEKASAVVVEVDDTFNPDSYQVQNLVDQLPQGANTDPAEICPAGSKLIVGKDVCSIE